MKSNSLCSGTAMDFLCVLWCYLTVIVYIIKGGNINPETFKGKKTKPDVLVLCKVLALPNVLLNDFLMFRKPHHPSLLPIPAVLPHTRAQA